MDVSRTAEDAEIRNRLKLDAGTSNKTHTAQEERTLRAMLLDEQRCLPELDREINRLELILTGLYSKREGHVSRIDRYSIALSPHKHLPSEILAQVFLHSMPHQRAVLPPGHTESPCVFLWVCSRWRKVALAEHRLWGHLEVQDRPSCSVEGMMTMWLPLLWTPTHTFPLSLRLSAFEGALALPDVFLPQMHRLYSISMNAFLGVIVTFLFGPPITFVNMEALTIRVRPGSLPKDVPHTAFVVSPRLRKIIIDDQSRGFVSRPTIFRLPLSQLTHLSLITYAMTLTDLEAVVRQCNNLVSLEIKSYRMSSLGFSPDGHCLPDIQSLTVVTTGHTFALDFLHHIQVPSMKEFTVDHKNQSLSRAFWNQASFDDMIRLSGCGLASLNILGPFQAISFGILLLDLKLLVKLVVSTSNPVPDTIFDMMIRGQILGQLEHLECSTLSPIPFLRLLEHQYKYLATGEYRGLSFADISYSPLRTTEDISEFLVLYDELKPRLKWGDKEIILHEFELDIQED